MSKLNRVYFLSFLFTLHVSLSAYVNSTFLASITGERYVGLLYTIAAFATLVLLSESANILKHFGNRKLVLSLVVINMISLVGIITSRDPYIVALAFVSLIATNNLVMLSMDIFIEHFGDKKTIGRTHGLYLTIINLAWVISPLITAILITYKGGYITIYTISFAITALTSLGLAFSVKGFEDSSYKKTPLLETYRYLKTNQHMLAITILNFILQFFFAWMVVYMPIYLHTHIGFNWAQIGVIFTIMLVPFVILGVPTGILADKYNVKKRTLLFIGFIIISLSTISISFVHSTDVALWALILFTTRVGASIIETTSEIYFFTHVTEEDAYLLGVFRDMTPVALMIAPVIATLIFIYLPFKYIFLILGVLTLSGLYYIPHLKHNHEHRQTNENQ
jgi:MFS family permease